MLPKLFILKYKYKRESSVYTIILYIIIDYIHLYYYIKMIYFIIILFNNHLFKFK